MSILRMASFKASYALFLKLVSGAIPTIAISASAMMGCALVCFRDGTMISSKGRPLLSDNIDIIFGIPNARMSSCLYFQGFQPLPRLDKFVSGIPNAMLNQSAVATSAAADAGPAFATPIESAGHRGREARVCRRD